MGQADPILTRLGAGPAVKKLVETALVLANSQDPQQRNHAYSFMESAIKELEDEVGKHDAVAKVFGEEEKDDKDDEHKIHEEVLDNHNNGPREDGSEQSTENTAPYAGEGVDTTNGEKPMQDMDDTVNQWSETNGMIVPGLPPVDAMNGGAAAGLDPNIAQEMGAQMQPMPPLNDNQMMRQMQYTIKHEMSNYNNKIVSPLIRHIKAQREALNDQRKAIKALSIEIRETKTNGGNMKLDLDSMRQNATASFRETESVGNFATFDDYGRPGIQPNPTRHINKIAIARSEIEQMDKMLNTQKNPMYT